MSENVSLKTKYQTEIKKKIQDKFNFKSTMAVPKLTKININMSVGRNAGNKQAIDDVMRELELITGQKPVINRARKSLASFKLREGMPMGAKITLRKERMYVFLEKLIAIALPRVRDFKGIPKNSFDNQGNYSLGIKEYIVFPEIDYDKVKIMKGMDVTFVFSSENKEANRMLMQEFGFPFKK